MKKWSCKICGYKSKKKIYIDRHKKICYTNHLSKKSKLYFEKYKNHIEKSLDNALNNKSKISNDILNIEGMTGTMTRHFYNNLCSMQDCRYLEVGCFKGSSTCSAMFKNTISSVSIDNWSELGGPKKEFDKNFKKFIGLNDSKLIESDFLSIDLKKLNKYNIYLYDGPHDYEYHEKSLAYYKDVLDEIFIFIVDDWNWKHVRRATYKSIVNNNLQILWEKEIRTSYDNSTKCSGEKNKDTWWNGIYIVILHKKLPINKSESYQEKCIIIDDNKSNTKNIDLKDKKNYKETKETKESKEKIKSIIDNIV